MNLCDSNVWLALVLSKHVHHNKAKRWFEGVDEVASIALCRQTQQTVLRLLTNAAVLGPYGNPPLSNRQAWEVLEALQGDDRVVFVADEPAGLESRWSSFALRDTASPKLWMDAYLAAFAAAAGHRMVTTDEGFRQFAGLEVLVLGD